jgi:uncharacterized membrane protein YkvA (DUF1232 family)
MRRNGWRLGFLGDAAALARGILDRRTPWLAKIAAGGAMLYLIDPFDLFPDVIPVLGWLDDATALAFGFWFASRLIPRQVMREARGRSSKAS